MYDFLTFAFKFKSLIFLLGKTVWKVDHLNEISPEHFSEGNSYRAPDREYYI